MFPRLKQRFAPAVLDRVDLLLELSTLGEYGLAEDGLPVSIEAQTSPDVLPNRLPAGCPGPRRRDLCPLRGRPSQQRCEPPAPA